MAGRRVALLSAVIAIVIVLSATILLQENTHSTNKGITIVTTFPGLKDDIMLIAGSCNVTVIELVYGDPHTAQLNPVQARTLAEADIVVTMGHTPADIKAGEIARGVVINVPSLDGIRLLKLPGNGINLHFPIYDPRNYIVSLETIARTLEDTGCAPDYDSLALIESLVGKYSGVAEGIVGVVDEPFIQYAVDWLGVEVRIVLNPGEHSQASGMILEEASRLLGQGAVAFIAVDEDGEPISLHGEWLAREASSTGAVMVKVPAPYTDSTIPDMLEYIVSQLPRR